jgi:hypothetical protein
VPFGQPALLAVAERIVATFQQAVRPTQTTAGGVQAVRELLLRGLSESDLLRAATNYAAWCNAHNLKLSSRKASRTFFGTWKYEDFLGSTWPESPAEKSDRLASEEEWVRHGK